MRRKSLRRACKALGLGVLGTVFTGIYAECYGVIVETVMKGFVTDARTGLPIPDIHVACDIEASYDAYTDDGGYYTIETDEYNIPADGQPVTCVFEDVDGAENGTYKSYKETVPYSSANPELDVALVPIP